MSPNKSAAEAWRMTGYLNVAWVSFCSAALLLCLVVSVVRGKDSLAAATVILEGSCDKTSTTNLFLHLLINAVSSGVLASSNYFMQVLSAPSRVEIDKTHARLRSLEIGIPSISNIFRVSRFKAVSYFILFFSSVPIHLFFNSAVFETQFQGSDWNLTIATEAFTKGAPFYPPGASLTVSGFPFPMSENVPSEWLNTSLTEYVGTACNDFKQWSDFTESIQPLAYIGGSTCGFGSTGGTGVQGQRYEDGVRSLYQGLNETSSQLTSGNATQWKELDAMACLKEYSICRPRMKYRDVVFVVDSPTSQGQGWNRHDVFGGSRADWTSYWDSLVPPEKDNSLWYSARCSTTKAGRSQEEANHCINTCAIVLGQYTMKVPVSSTVTRDDAFLPVANFEIFGDVEQNPFTFSEIELQKCYAQIAAPTCRVGVSNLLLLVVTICFLLKATQCAIVLWKIPSSSIVTPGDALESFIMEPDSTTLGLCTLDMPGSLRLQQGARLIRSPTSLSELQPGLISRKFTRQTHRLSSILPAIVWKRTYGVFVLGAVGLLTGLVFGVAMVGWQNTQSLGASDSNLVMAMHMLSFLSFVVFANSPQLLVSFCYFMYNAFFTRLQVEKEWNSYGASYRPLRVSYPRGGQTSTYFLGLPYRWSIPLITLSALLHWLVSVSLFIFISEGGYWQDSGNAPDDAYTMLSLSADSTVMIGYSQMGIVMMCTLSFAAMSLPVLLSMEKVKSRMIPGGCDSLVLSAACHCFPGSSQTSKHNGAPPPQIERLSFQETHAPPSPTTSKRREQQSSAAAATSEQGSSSTTNDQVAQPQPAYENDMAEKLEEMAQGPVRWGAIEPPAHLRDMVTPREGEKLMHLGFGNIYNDVREPRDDEWYA